MDCCEAAVDDLKEVPMGIAYLKSYRTVQKWYDEFCDNNKKIVAPSVSMRDKIKNLLPVFDIYSDLQEVIMDFCSNNIVEPTVDTAQKYINKCLQIMTKHKFLFEINDDEIGDDSSKNESKDEGEKFDV
eukprot:9748535-Ditylum_brightwellii.AAC.1